jgi:DNA-binding CsgD family transcriptional regulator
VAAASFTASGLAMAVARRRSMQDRFALSPRESQVLNLLHEGLSIPVIAHEMYISVSTAKTYVARLYEKLGAANRAQALMTALHHGLINYRQEASPQVAMAGHGPRREAGPEGLRREAGPEGLSPVAERAASALSSMALAASRRKPAIPA